MFRWLYAGAQLSVNVAMPVLLVVQASWRRSRVLRDDLTVGLPRRNYRDGYYGGQCQWLLRRTGTAAD